MERRHFARAVWALTATAAVVACSSAEPVDDGQFEGDHTAGEYIQRNHPMYWLNASYQEQRRIADARSWRTDPQPVGAEDAAQQWLQAWADRIDEIVRAKVLADTGEELVAPKPVMHLLPSKTRSNAWVTSLPACVDWPVRAASAAADAMPAGHAEFRFGRARLSALGEADGRAACVEKPEFLPHRDLFVSEWNLGSEECKIHTTAEALEVPDACADSLQATAGAAIYAVSPHVQFSSDLLAAGTEAGAVFVIAHELAHYYRAHGSPLARHKYNFWYDQDPKKARRPVPSREAEELKQLYLEIEAMPPGNELHIAGSAHTPRQRRAVLSAVCNYMQDERLLRNQNACSALVESCDVAVGLLTDGTVSEEQVEAYLKLERELPQCASQVPLDPEQSTTEALIAELRQERLLLEKDAQPRNLGEALSVALAHAKVMDAKIEKFAERLRKGGIGLYTTEQEADDLALEWTTMLGFTPEAAMEGWLEYLKFFESRGGGGRKDMSAQECAALYAKDFKDGRAYTTVWLGDLNSPHHAGCYRVYNLWREQRAHRYQAATDLPEFAGPKWEDAKAQAEHLTETANDGWW